MRKYLEAASFIVAMVAGISTAVAACEDVYREATRNLSFTQTDIAQLNALFDHHCRSTGELNQQTFDSSAGFPIEGIPVEFTGDFSNLRTRSENFCQNYRNVRFDTQHNTVANSIVVVEALNSFNQCKAIEQQSRGVTVTHQFAAPDTILINFTFYNNLTLLALQGVATSDNIICRSNMPANGFSGGEVNDQTVFTIDRNFAMICSRSGVPQQDGSVEYRPGSIAVATNSGSYIVPVLADTLYSNHLASQATSTIGSLQANLNDVTARFTATSSNLNTLTERLRNLRLESKTVVLGQFHPGGNIEHRGCGSSIEAVQAEICPGAVSITNHHVQSVGGHQCGYATFSVACVYY